MAANTLGKGLRACKGCHVKAQHTKSSQAHIFTSSIRSQTAVETPRESGYHPVQSSLDSKGFVMRYSKPNGPPVLGYDKSLPLLSDTENGSPIAKFGKEQEVGIQDFDGTSREGYYWQSIPRWKDITETQWNTYKWQLRNTVPNKKKVVEFLHETLPAEIPLKTEPGVKNQMTTREVFIEDFEAGMKSARMAVRITPHILSLINWNNPYNDPLRMQFIPLASTLKPDHPETMDDSLSEKKTSIVPGLLTQRYPDKVLMTVLDYCPIFCRYCTRAYQVGASTELLQKGYLPADRKRWEEGFEAIAARPVIRDVVASGGDTYMLKPEDLQYLGLRLLNIPNIKRIRIASKGLAVDPSRFLDPNDKWVEYLIYLSNYARSIGKSVALHTHFEHPNEITWITRKAALRLHQASVVVRNQTVLLKGVNDTPETMGKLIHDLADINIQPYYVYQCDMVPGVEDLRTPLSTILSLESQLRGTISGFMMPQFVVDLPGGGGKRLASSYISYKDGVSVFTAPAISGDKKYYYYDPLPADPKTPSLSLI